MSETENSRPVASRRAHEIPRGHVVSWPGEATLFIKAERQGTDYIHHYLVQIDPVKAEGLALIYIDPEEVLVDAGCAPVFDYSNGESRPDPEIGHIFENPKGAFLKVIEDPKSQKMFAFIDITNGEVRRRQERDVKTVYAGWSITLKI